MTRRTALQGFGDLSRVRCVTLSRTVRWHEMEFPPHTRVDLPVPVAERLAALGFVQLVPQLAPRPPRPEPVARPTSARTLALIEEARLMPWERARSPLRRDSRMPRWTATDAPRFAEFAGVGRGTPNITDLTDDEPILPRTRGPRHPGSRPDRRHAA